MTSFEYEGKDYELQMTRAGVAAAEDQGLTTTVLQEKPLSAVTLLFFAALYKYRVNPNKAKKMLDDLIDSGTVEFSTLFEELAEEYGKVFGLGESS